MGKMQKHILAMALAAVIVASGAVAAQSAEKRSLQLTAGAAQTIDLPGQVADVLVANPAVADVGTLRADRLYVVGRTIGDTNILAFDAGGNQLAEIAVHVRMDEGNVRETLLKFFPDEDIDVKTVRGDLVLTGKVSTPAVAGQVRELAGRFVAGQGQSLVDLMQVAGEQQVMLKVRMLEVARSVLREYGVDTDYTADNETFFGVIGGQGLRALTPFAVGQATIRDTGKFGPLTVSLRALEENGLVKTLAEPNLTAISGETAGFLAGGEFPVPSSRDQSGNVALTFRQFGVSLNFTPTVLSRDSISLQLSTEVSARSDSDGVTLTDTFIPGLSVRRADTTVQIGSGGTLMIAGLLKSDDVHSLTGMPGISDLPIIGELFKSKSFKKDETELVILVTPYLVQPYAEMNANVVSGTVAMAPHAAPASVDAPVAINPDVTGAYRVPVPAHAAAHTAATSAAPASAARQNALSGMFLQNLKTAYGQKVSGRTAGGAAGYIVD